MKLPIVSILIPVYNREKFIGPCIQSALDQTYTDLEIVVVDNASSDQTLAICREYAAKDSRVRVFCNSINIGPVENWRRCIAEAKGEYGKLLFSDDLMEPDFLGKTLPFMQNDEIGFVFSSVLIGDEPGSGKIYYNFRPVTGIFPSKHYIDEAYFGCDVPFSPGGAIFRLTDLRSNLVSKIISPTIKNFADHGAGPDLLIYLLTAMHYTNIAYIVEPLSFFRHHAGSITISETSVDIQRYYRQAKIWFAQNYLDQRIFSRLCAHEWKRECRQRKKWRLPLSFLSDYAVNSASICFLDIIKVLIFKSRKPAVRKIN